MKKISILVGSLLCILTTSCDKFLELTPRDQKVVSTIEDYRDIMASFMYYLKTPDMPRQENIFGIDAFTVPFHSDVHGNLAVYTGEVNINTNSSQYYDKKAGDYTQTGKSMQTWLMSNEEAWRQYYNFLGPINLIISDISTAKGDNENLRNYVKGEALVWRAYTYFKLLQYYAPYKDNNYGIPVYLTPQMEIGTTMPSRETQQTVFGQIFADCNAAFDLMEQTLTNEWNFIWRKDFIHAMLASVYTWKAMSGAAEPSDWEDAGKHATEAMKGRSLTHSAETLKRVFDCSTATYTVDLTNDEFFVRIMDGEYTNVCDLYSTYLQDNVSDGRITATYASFFTDSDIRKSVWFKNGMYNNKYNMMGENGKCRGCLLPFRLAEMFLIKAEALCRQEKDGEARSVLIDFCNARYTFAPEIPSGHEALLNAILDERNREFYQEGDFRWLDMKRLGIRMERTISGERHVLAPDDFRYSFPIPAREMKLNKNMVQNPGWEQIIIY